MITEWVSGFFSRDLAIDLGTANTLVYSKGRGICINEPSVVAFTANGIGRGKVLAVGREAKLMVGRTPGGIVTLFPMKQGVIADFDIAEAMLRYFIHRAQPRSRMAKPRIIIGVPSGITPVEKKAVREAAQDAGAREVFFIEEPVAAAIGAGMPVTEPRANMIVDIGGGTTEVAVISLGGIVYSSSVRVAGNRMDEAIVEYVKRKHRLLIGADAAEMIKTAIGNALPQGRLDTVEVRGRDLVSGIPRGLIIDSGQAREAISPQINTILEAVRSSLERMPPELAADLVDWGVMLAGGGALLRNLDAFLSAETGLPVHVAEDPLSAVALGAGKALDYLHLLRGVLSE